MVVVIGGSFPDGGVIVKRIAIISGGAAHRGG